MHADPHLEVLPSADSTPQAVTEIIGKLDNYLQNSEVQERHIGVAFCIVDQGRTYFSNHGFSTLNPEIPMHQDCLLPIGSVTKTLTGLAAVRLALDGAFSLEDSVAASFDSLPAGSPFESITWHQLLSHRAGLPREPDNFTFGRITPYEDYGPEALHEAMSTYDGPALGPHPWAYSNFGYLIIGEHLKRLTQSNYETLIKDLVTRHFRENDARIDLVDGDRWGLGHGQEREPQPMGFFNSFEPVGGVRASARFLAGYIQGCLDPGSIPALQDALNLSLTIDGDGHGKNTAFSWNIRELDGQRIYYHSGFVRGCKGSVLFCPEMDRGLAYVCNTPFHIRTIFDLMMT